MYTRMKLEDREKHQISLPCALTQAYGINSIKYKTVKLWNEMVMKTDEI